MPDCVRQLRDLLQRQFDFAISPEKGNDIAGRCALRDSYHRRVHGDPSQNRDPAPAREPPPPVAQRSRQPVAVPDARGGPPFGPVRPVGGAVSGGGAGGHVAHQDDPRPDGDGGFGRLRAGAGGPAVEVDAGADRVGGPRREAQGAGAVGAVEEGAGFDAVGGADEVVEAPDLAAGAGEVGFVGRVEVGEDAEEVEVAGGGAADVGPPGAGGGEGEAGGGGCRGWGRCRGWCRGWGPAWAWGRVRWPCGGGGSRAGWPPRRAGRCATRPWWDRRGGSRRGPFRCRSRSGRGVGGRWAGRRRRGA